jgi:uncharacterized Tic20 family protein
MFDITDPANGEVTIDVTGNVIRVLYVVDPDWVYEYTVVYYFDGDIDDSMTEDREVQVLSNIIDSVPMPSVPGFIHVSTNPGMPLTIVDGTVIRVDFISEGILDDLRDMGITMQAGSIITTYDGQLHDPGFTMTGINGNTVGAGDLPNLVTINADTNARSTNRTVVPVQNVLSNIVIDVNGVDITHLIDELITVDTTPGTLMVHRRPITVTTGSAEMVLSYLLFHNVYTVGGYEFVAGESINVFVNGYRIDIGTSPNTFFYTFNLLPGSISENYIVTGFLGSLTIFGPTIYPEEPPPVPEPGIVGPGLGVVEDDDTDIFLIDPVTPLVPEPPIVVEEVEVTEEYIEIDDYALPLEPAEPPVEEIYDPVIQAPIVSRTWALLNLILSVAVAVASIVLVIGFIKRRQDVSEDGKHKESYKFGRTVRLASLLPALLAVVMFIITQDLRALMVIVDSWTILFGVITIVQAVLTIIAIRSDKDKGEYRGGGIGEVKA